MHITVALALLCAVCAADAIRPASALSPFQNEHHAFAEGVSGLQQPSGRVAAGHQGHPKLFSVTLVTRPDADLNNALRSVVNLVYSCLVVYPGSGGHSLEGPPHAAQDAVGNKLVVQELQHATNLGQMFNASLNIAANAGADWAMLIQPDQQLHLSQQLDLPQTLAAAEAAGITQLNCYNQNAEYYQVSNSPTVTLAFVGVHSRNISGCRCSGATSTLDQPNNGETHLCERSSGSRSSTLKAGCTAHPLQQAVSDTGHASYKVFWPPTPPWCCS